MSDQASRAQLLGRSNKHENSWPNPNLSEPFVACPSYSEIDMEDPGRGQSNLASSPSCDPADMLQNRRRNYMWETLVYMKNFSVTCASMIFRPEIGGWCVRLVLIGSCVIVIGLLVLLLTKSDTGDHIPESLNYQDHDIVTPVKDEGNCSSSFAFAAIAAFESKYALLNRKCIDLSEQQILDYCKRVGTNGCYGGSFPETLNCMEYAGVATEAEIPYKRVGNRSCEEPWRKYSYHIVDWKPIEPNEEAIKEAIYKYGPVVASLTADANFFHYAGGVFTSPSNALAMPNHGVLIVGYGVENGFPVWHIKNSHGTSWGKGGFMIMERGKNLREIADGVYAIIHIKDSGSTSMTSD